jgi:hypothetical protein
LRRDGSPRISGTEVEFADGELWLGHLLIESWHPDRGREVRQRK